MLGHVSHGPASLAAPHGMPAQPQHVVLMGVSGSGKTTVAALLVERLGWPFMEADSMHPPANIAKMSRGEPLTDEDRGPWLMSIRDWMTRRANAGNSTIATCSALKRRYRDVLRTASGRVRFVFLTGDPALISARLRMRDGHFMPASLLDSQFADLEPLDADEDGLTIPAHGIPEQMAIDILAGLSRGSAALTRA